MGRREEVPLGSRLVTLRRHWQVVVGALAVLVGVGLGVAAAAILTRNEAKPPLPGPAGIMAQASLSPRVLLFGDHLTARFDVVVDRRRINPDFVRIETSFSPFMQVAGTRTRRDEGDITELEYAVTLECITLRCLPAMTRKRDFTFPSARLVYREPARVGSIGHVISIELPPVGIASRMSAQEVAEARAANPVRVVEGPASGLVVEDAPLLVRDRAGELPAASYRISPAPLVAILVVLAALLTIGAGVLVVRQLRPAPAVAASAPEAPALSPLEHALGQLDLALANGQVDQQRRALELLARELGQAGEDALAREARHLAWGEDRPARAETRALAETVRTTVDGRDDGRPA